MSESEKKEEKKCRELPETVFGAVFERRVFVACWRLVASGQREPLGRWFGRSRKRETESGTIAPFGQLSRDFRAQFVGNFDRFKLDDDSLNHVSACEQQSAPIFSASSGFLATD